MNWNLFSNELNKQMNIVGISGRALSKKVNKSSSYINQILNDRVKEVDYNIAIKIFKHLNLIDTKMLDYYLFLLGVDLPENILINVNVSNMMKNKFTVEQCYKESIDNITNQKSVKENIRNFNLLRIYKKNDENQENDLVEIQLIDEKKEIVMYGNQEEDVTEKIKNFLSTLDYLNVKYNIKEETIILMCYKR